MSHVDRLTCWILLTATGFGGIGSALGEPTAGARTPTQEKDSFELADPTLEVELVASEPDVVSPVAMAWDAQGRMFVAEMRDYPVGPLGGSIRILQDKDADGRYETSAVFADQLPFPNSVLPWNEGVLITAAPDLLYLKDTDGDLKGEFRRLLFTGFNEGNQQLRANGLTWGMDGWIYGANGRSDGEVKTLAPDSRVVSLKGHDFRFHPDSLDFESVAGRSQFGLARDDWGNRFLSWNTVPIRHDVIPETYLARNSSISAGSGIANLLPSDDDNRVFPRTPPPKTFNQESTSHFNALGGLTIYRGDALPAEYQGNAFVGETLRNLIHRRVLVPKGTTFTAERREKGKEFLASSDPWFHPVNFATGPDGALYVADFYRLWVEHPGFVPETQRQQANWREGAEHGRIWRIRSKKRTPPRSVPNLQKASTADLVARLEDTNAWQRDTAQRLLLERKDPASINALKDGPLKSRSPVTRLLSLWTLNLLGGLDETNVLAALSDVHPRVREHAIRIAEPKLAQSPFLMKRVLALSKDRDDRVRMQLALSCFGAGAAERTEALYQVSQQSNLDRFGGLAIRTSQGDRPWPLLEQILWGERSYLEASPDRLDFFRSLAQDVGRLGPDPDRVSLLNMLVNFKARGLDVKHLALFSGWISGWSGQEPEALNRFPTLLDTDERKSWWDDFVHFAKQSAESTNSNTSVREFAVDVLARAQTPEALGALRSYLNPTQPTALQLLAARTLGGVAKPDVLKSIYDGWSGYSTTARRGLLSASVQSKEKIAILLNALESGRVAPTELDPAVRQSLQQNQTEEFGDRIRKLLGPKPSADRQSVIDTYSAALKTGGDSKRGAAVFSKACLSCHRLQNKGTAVGPDLAGIANRTPDALLVDILDPSRQVASDFVGYTLTTTNGDSVSGLLVSDTAAGVTLRKPNAPDELIPRARIRSLQASGRSLMPDGLESGMSPGDMADLVQFLTHPGSAPLP